MTFFHARITLLDIESSLSERRRDARAVWRQLAPDSLVLAVAVVTVSSTAVAENVPANPPHRHVIKTWPVESQLASRSCFIGITQDWSDGSRPGWKFSSNWGSFDKVEPWRNAPRRRTMTGDNRNCSAKGFGQTAFRQDAPLPSFSSNS
jgi:hypothetical protein